MSILKTARLDYKETFENNGITCYEYDAEDYRPPCVVVVPNPRNYVRPGRSENKTLATGWKNIGLNIIVIGTKGVKAQNVDDLDDMLEKVLTLLSDAPACHILSVGGHASLTLNRGDYFGCAIEVEHNAAIPRA